MEKVEVKTGDGTVAVPIEKLDEEWFREYGDILRPGHPIYPKVENNGEGSVMMLEATTRPNRVTRLAFHPSYSQAFIPVKGTAVFIVAPAPLNVEKTRNEWQVDYSRIRAFTLEPGQGILVNHGVGHYLVPLDDHCTVASVTRNHRQEYDKITAGLKGGVPKSSEYVEFVDLEGRDGRSIELV